MKHSDLIKWLRVKKPNRNHKEQRRFRGKPTPLDLREFSLSALPATKEALNFASSEKNYIQASEFPKEEVLGEFYEPDSEVLEATQHKNVLTMRELYDSGIHTSLNFLEESEARDEFDELNDRDVVGSGIIRNPEIAAQKYCEFSPGATRKLKEEGFQFINRYTPRSCLGENQKCIKPLSL